MMYFTFSQGTCVKTDTKACESCTCDSSKIGTNQTCAGITDYCYPNGLANIFLPNNIFNHHIYHINHLLPQPPPLLQRTTTTTLPPCSCSQCGFYSSPNCNYACNEWQNCVQSTCSASGCISNPNCYKCEWKSCSQVNPKVYILTPFIIRGVSIL